MIAFLLAGLFVAVPAAGQSATASQSVAPRTAHLSVDVQAGASFLRAEAIVVFEARARLTEVVFRLRSDLQVEAIENERAEALLYEREEGRVRVFTRPLDAGELSTWRFLYRMPLDRGWEAEGQVVSVTPWYPHVRDARTGRDWPSTVPMRFEVSARLPPGWQLVAAGTEQTFDGEGVSSRWSDSQPSSVLPLLIGRFGDPLVVEGRAHTLTAFMPSASSSLVDAYADYMLDALQYYGDTLGASLRRRFVLAGLDLPEEVGGVSTPGITVVPAPNVMLDTPFPYRVFAHEVAHHWWSGDRFPRRSDGWLREGLPTYTALLFLEQAYGGPMFRRELERTRLIATDAAQPLPLLSSHAEPDLRRRYALNYHKGAFVLHMLRGVMGREAFVRLLRQLNSAGGPLTTERLIGAAERIHGDLGWFFDSWLRHAEIPRLVVRYRQDRSDDEVSPVQLRVWIEQQRAAVRHPVTLRVFLEGAPPVERRVWIDEGTVELAVPLPSVAERLELDPAGDLLHDGISIAPEEGRPER